VEIHGTYDSTQQRADVYRFLANPRQVAQVMPNSAAADVTDRGFTAHEQVGVGPLAGTMDIHLELANLQADREAEYRGDGHGLGSTFTMSMSFRLADRVDSQGTRIDWTGEAKLDGPIGSLADKALEHFARQNVERLMESMDRLLSSDRRDSNG
jgi:carbon monoxide dehydrogenase subunit G